MEAITHLIDQYSYLILFGSLMLELIALPLPTEILMSYSGYLIYQHQMNFIFSLVCSAGGTIAGMTIAFWIGSKLGYPFFRKYGSKFHVGPERLDRFSAIYERFGVGLLLISCFIPGVRHVTSYFAGISRIPYKRFALFSSLGAILWTGTFLTLGWALGPQYKLIEVFAKKYLWILIIGVLLLIMVFLLIRYQKARIQAFLVGIIEEFYINIKSKLRLKMLIIASLVIFAMFVTFAVILIDNLLDVRYKEFNQVTMELYKVLLDGRWTGVMNFLFSFGTETGLGITALVSVVWILIHRRNIRLELQMWVVNTAGGVLFTWLVITGIKKLQSHFGFILPGTSTAGLSYSAILTIIVYGFLIYSFTRHVRSYWLKTTGTVAGMAVFAGIGLSYIYFNTQEPSFLITSYIIGAVWVSFVILLMEILRLIQIVTALDVRNES